MEIKSYNNIYVHDVANNLGTMFMYAVNSGFNHKIFWGAFVNSVVAKEIEKGNPKFLVGCAGNEFIDHVRKMLGEEFKETKINLKPLYDRDKYFWSAWAIAQYQHKTSISFKKLNNYISINKVLNLYPTLHEADITKFYDTVDSYVKDKTKDTNLKTIRMANGLSQSGLAKASGVDIRSIQMYEQRKNDINKAQVDTMMKLSKALGCTIEDLLEG